MPMLPVSQCRNRHTPKADQLNKNGATRQPACIASIQTATTQSTFFQLNRSRENESKMSSTVTPAGVAGGADGASDDDARRDRFERRLVSRMTVATVFPDRGLRLQ